MEYQLQLEKQIIDHAIISNIKIIIYDRGILDCIPYLPNKNKEFENRYNLSIANILTNNYDKIIHLVSLATTDNKLFKQYYQNNPHRVEDLNLARKRDQDLINTWKYHLDWNVIEGTEEFKYKYIENIIMENLYEKHS